MSLMRILPLGLAVSLALAGCSAPDVPPADAVVTTAEPEPAATATATVVPTPEPAPVVSSIPVHDPAVIHFGGYRAAAFNSNADALRAAHTGNLVAQPAPASPEACHYLMPEGQTTTGEGTAFMFEGGKFVRFDVHRADLVAPGGLTTGMTDVDVLSTFPDTEQQPHKYTNGRYLVVKPADAGSARLVFEVDEQGTITEWRIGLEPQVHYVEGCS